MLVLYRRSEPDAASPMMNAFFPLAASSRVSIVAIGALLLTLNAWSSLSSAEAQDLREEACDQLLVVVEEQPQLIGGMEALRAQVRYPDGAQTAGVEGRVFVQFIVDTRGQVLSPVVTRGVRADLDAEAVRVVKAAQFTPGRQRGEAVCVQMALPITFRADAPSARSPADGGQPSNVVEGALQPVNDATASVQSTAASATGTVDEAATTVENSVTSATDQVDEAATSVDETASSIDEASSSVEQGVEDTKASVSDAYSSSKEGVSEAAESVRSTFRGLFGRKKNEAPPSEAESGAPAPASSGERAVPAAEAAFAAGDVVAAKVDNIQLLANPASGAAVLATVTTADQLVYLGEEQNGHLLVQGADGQGWINKLLVEKQ